MGTLNVDLSCSVLENEELLLKTLDFCDEVSRFHFMFLSKKHYQLLTSDISFRWRLDCLHRERGIYYHPSLLISNSTSNNTKSWKDVFLYNYSRRNLWNGETTTTTTSTEDTSSEQKFNIQVAARFRPKNDYADGNYHHRYEKKIALPLYQRLALIKMNRNLQTKKEAFQVLCQQGDWFGIERRDDDDDVEENVTTDDKNGSSGSGLRSGVHLIDSKNNFAVLVDPIKGLRKFEFDNVFHDTYSQEVVYFSTARPLIAEFMNGYNASCIVYGQTGR